MNGDYQLSKSFSQNYLFFICENLFQTRYIWTTMQNIWKKSINRFAKMVAASTENWTFFEKKYFPETN